MPAAAWASADGPAVDATSHYQSDIQGRRPLQGRQFCDDGSCNAGGVYRGVGPQRKRLVAGCAISCRFRSARDLRRRCVGVRLARCLSLKFVGPAASAARRSGWLRRFRR